MSDFTEIIARRADSTLERMHNRLKRYLNRESLRKKRALKLTLGKAYEASWEGLSCVFALSTGRTGTQTLAALLRLSPHVVATHEPAPRLVKASLEAYLEVGAEDWLHRWAPFVLAARDDFVLEANAEGKVYVESNNRLTYLASALQQAFPSSKFIFSHRDPHEVIRSGMQRGAYQGPGKAWNFARIRPRDGEACLERWKKMSPLEKEAWRWSRINEEAKAFYDQLPEDRRLELPSKDFFSGRPEVYEKIYEFIGVPSVSETEIKKILHRKMNAQAHYNGLSFSWTDEKREIVRPHIEKVASVLGYNT